jgi:hypothetical protein
MEGVSTAVVEVRSKARKKRGTKEREREREARSESSFDSSLQQPHTFSSPSKAIGAAKTQQEAKEAKEREAVDERV